MANVGTVNFKGETQEIIGIAGTGDNAVVIELQSAERWNSFTLMSDAGAMDVDVSLDGTNFAPAIALEDLHSLTPATRVIVTAADRLYHFEGTYKTIRVRQNVTNPENSFLYCARSGRG